MRVLIVLLAGLVCLRGTHAAAASTLDRTNNGDDVSATFASPITDLPPGGCVPYTVTIRNDRDVSGTWRVTFQASATISATGPHLLFAGPRRGAKRNRGLRPRRANATGRRAWQSHAEHRYQGTGLQGRRRPVCRLHLLKQFQLHDAVLPDRRRRFGQRGDGPARNLLQEHERDLLRQRHPGVAHSHGLARADRRGPGSSCATRNGSH